MSLHRSSVRRGEKWVLRDVTWNLEPAQRWALIGDNGAGKTQLLKLLSGDVWPTPRAGEGGHRGTRAARAAGIEWAGNRSISSRRNTGSPTSAPNNRTSTRATAGICAVRDLVATGLHRTDLMLRPATPIELGRVAATLRSCGLSRLAGREFLTLSYGQKRLALLARALVQDPGLAAAG